MNRPARSAVAGLVSALGARLAYRVLADAPPGGAGRWQRTNHRGEPITLLEGPAWAAGAVAALAVPSGPARLRLAGAVATGTAAAFGAVDDLTGSPSSRGLRGHLGALARGELTTGALKILGIGAGGLISAVIIDAGAGGRPAGGSPDADRSGRRVAGALAGTLVGGALVAGTANLVNLLDLRPGRALKVVLAAGGPAALSRPGGELAAAAVGASAALLGEDLGERSMLGDTGANAAGALLGTALISRLGARGRGVALAGVIALTLASERVSFSRVIESTPVLRWWDGLGRRPR